MRQVNFRVWDKDRKQMFNVTTLFNISEGKAEPWVVDIAIGFKEAMRLLKPNGVLVFKWNDDQIKLSEVLKCIDYEPLFGDKRSKTHWLFFMKESKR